MSKVWFYRIKVCTQEGKPQLLSCRKWKTKSSFPFATLRRQWNCRFKPRLSPHDTRLQDPNQTKSSTWVVCRTSNKFYITLFMSWHYISTKISTDNHHPRYDHPKDKMYSINMVTSPARNNPIIATPKLSHSIDKNNKNQALIPNIWVYYGSTD